MEATRAHRCRRHPNHRRAPRLQRLGGNPFVLVPIVLLLGELLGRKGEITTRLSDRSNLNFMGLTEFATRHVDERLTEAEFPLTLVHELMHHLSGPTYPRFAALEEARTEAGTAAIMLDARRGHVVRAGRRSPRRVPWSPFLHVNGSGKVSHLGSAFPLPHLGPAWPATSPPLRLSAMRGRDDLAARGGETRRQTGSPRAPRSCSGPPLA